MGTIDVTSGAIPARVQQALPTEHAAGASFNGASAYKRQTRRWRPGAAEPISDAFAMRATNLKTAELDLRRMRLPEFGTIDATIDADAELVLRLRGSFGERDHGHPRRPDADRPHRRDHAHRDAAGRYLAPAHHAAGADRSGAVQARRRRCACARRAATACAPCGSSSTASACGPSAGAPARRTIRIKLPAAGGRVTVRATTRKGRRLVRRRTYRACR